MPLFKIPEAPATRNQTDSRELNVKLKRGQTISDLINTARQLVMDKLGKYKDTSKCVTDINELRKFFEETEDILGIDTETTGLNTFSDTLVGISLCNGKQAIYIPLNHKSSLYNIRLNNQMNIQQLKDLFKEVLFEPRYKFIYHNAKFDLAVLRTFLGYPMPDPYWDTMLAGNLFFQDEEHSLKYLYNKYIAEEDEGVNRFDTLFKGITFDYIPLIV